MARNRLAQDQPAGTGSAPTGNRLGEETSPYLLQHADNPVHWRAWGTEALAEAREANKPILLSIGYAACHWCHVMAHESFEDKNIAGLMNDHFVNIKVDREERPDLDTIYQSALAMTGQQGGWPLTMFLTPQGRPFWGGTYFPSTRRFGRPGFPEVLEAIAAVWRDEPEKVTQNVKALGEALQRLSHTNGAGTVRLEALDEVAERLASEFDPVWGGLGTAPKFPQVPILTLLWNTHLRTGGEVPRDAVLRTLAAMAQGGIYDHLGGGFARYATDREWLVPHFEKMLYDNAQLLSLLGRVWAVTRNPLFAERARETAEWVLREMVVAQGGFASTLDADSEGEEGRFYVWTKAEIDKALGKAAEPFAAAYDVTEGGNWEGRTILNRRHERALRGVAEEKRLAKARAKLLKIRSKRVRPGWDDKVLADWNGLMITALADVGRLLAEPAWIEAAARAFAFVAEEMTVDGRLCQSWRHGQPRHAATLDVYANMARAALALFEATGEADYLDQAQRWVGDADLHYWDGEAGGYFFTAADAEDLIVRTKTAHDNAVPAGNGTMLEVSARLFLLTGDGSYFDRAERIEAAFSGELARNFVPLSTYLAAVEFKARAVQVVVVGPEGREDTEALLETALRAPIPQRIVLQVAPYAGLPHGHPAAGKTMAGEKATAYVCPGLMCLAPVTEPAALEETLAEAARSRMGGRAPGGAT